MRATSTAIAALAVGLVSVTVGVIPAGAQPGGRRPERDARAQLLELAHRVVVEEAIDVLPKRLKKFYKNHRMEIDAISTASSIDFEKCRSVS